MHTRGRREQAKGIFMRGAFRHLFSIRDSSSSLGTCQAQSLSYYYCWFIHIHPYSTPKDILMIQTCSFNRILVQSKKPVKSMVPLSMCYVLIVVTFVWLTGHSRDGNGWQFSMKNSGHDCKWKNIYCPRVVVKLRIFRRDVSDLTESYIIREKEEGRNGMPFDVEQCNAYKKLLDCIELFQHSNTLCSWSGLDWTRHPSVWFLGTFRGK